MVVMGRVLAPYGVAGRIKVEAFTATPGALLDYGRWWLSGHAGHDAWREFEVRSARLHGGALLAELAGLADREAAAKWRGALLGVPRASLPRPPAGEVYWADLTGLAAINREGQVLGTVAGVLEAPAHPVLRIERQDGGERLVPLVAAYVDAIDLAASRIVIDWQADY